MKTINTLLSTLCAFMLFLSPNTLSAQCANASNIHSFSYNGTSYELVKENKTWVNAATCAVSRGGILAEIDNVNEQNAIFSEISANGGITNSNTVAPDGGGGAYIWIGGNDILTEGNWIWDGDNTGSSVQFWMGTSTGTAVGGLYSNWGNEPDNFGGQDALGLSLNGWPLGVSGQWNDVDETNTLYYLIELLGNINDSIAPVPDSGQLPNVTNECFILNPVIPTATDSFAGTINGISDISFPILGLGTYHVTWTFTDPSGNSSTQPQMFIVSDTVAPTPNLSTLTDITEQCSIDSILATPTANDLCAGTINGTTNTNFPILTQGTTVVTWSFDDGNGNVSYFDQNIIIQDTTPPILSQPLSPIISNCDVLSIPQATATDNCSGQIIGNNNASLPITDQDTTIVEWEFIDSNGNILYVSQIIYINPLFNQIERNGLTLDATEPGLTYQWLDCENNYSEILGQTSQSLLLASNGIYSVIVSDGICLDTSDCITVSDLSTSLYQTKPSLEIFPNPTTNEITIKNLQTNEDYEIKLWSINGQILTSHIVSNINNQYKLKINEAPGVYTLTVASTTKITTFKLIKE